PCGARRASGGRDPLRLGSAGGAEGTRERWREVSEPGYRDNARPELRALVDIAVLAREISQSRYWEKRERVGALLVCALCAITNEGVEESQAWRAAYLVKNGEAK